MIDITDNDLKKSYNQVKNELKNYSSKLSKKKELVVLNKTDLIDRDKVKKIIKDFSKNTKSEVITLSTIQKDSIIKIKSKLISYVS
jgi:GTP-binding protein